MPELPEVETIVRQLNKSVAGRQIKGVKVNLNKIVRTGPRKLVKLLTNAKIRTVRRIGKNIIFEFDKDRYLVVHLKMTGQFLLVKERAEHPKHVHVVLKLNRDMELLYRDMRQFGYFLGFSKDEYLNWLEQLDIGPDPFQMSQKEFASGLKTRRGRIKPLLLSQRFVSGLGNIYADEALFASQIHPLTAAKNIKTKTAEKLYKEIKKILTKAIKHGGSTIQSFASVDRKGGKFQKFHKVYKQDGSPCPVCSTEIIRTVVGGRGTYWCLKCQPKM